MFIPRQISHIAIKIFRLLKKRIQGTSIMEEVVAFGDGEGSW